ncbi:tetratricopeptide repeat protein [Neochlamydia sp. AcF95]|uniref:tetratricopeptide repeat protein n=1 Tax=Neochlamydia sp. AcF95 TaxID=2795734 RepID=UPI001BCA4A90|nr:tetratricopeptide repeat protein [Neochlamydia sp. AcF95]MBS4171395.1 Uncharacterized protein [Neochlamydia sp. AcF95]
MSISSSKAFSPFTRGSYPKLGNVLPFYAANKPLSSVLFHSKSVSIAFRTLSTNHQYISTFKHDKMPRAILTQVHPDHLLCSPSSKNKRFYSKKTKSEPSRELLEQVKKINAELKSRLERTEGEIKTLLGESKSELVVLKDKVNLLPTKVVNNINESKSKKWIISSGFGMVVGIPGLVFKAQLTDYFNKYFKGEINHIDFLDKNLSSTEDWIQTRNLTKLKNIFKTQEFTIQKIALIGISGSGKTTLAKQYALHYEQERKDQPEGIRTVFYGDMREYKTFKCMYRKFAEDLGVKVPAGASKEEIIREVNKKLITRPNWLFIVDNLDPKKYEKLKAFLPKRPEATLDFYSKWPEELEAFFTNSLKGKILLIAHEELEGAMSFNMQANTISEKEALNIFDVALGKNHWSLNQAHTSKRKLVRQLSYLPLAIKQSAIYFKYAKPTDSFDSLVDSYLTQLKSLIKMRTDGHKETVDASKLLEAMVSWQKKEKQAGGSFFHDLLKLNKDKLTFLIESKEEGSSRILVDIGPLLEAMQLTSIKSDERQKKFNSNDSLMTSFIGELQELREIKKVNLNQVDAKQLLKAIYSLNVQECMQIQNECKNFFTMIPFFNPYLINESLIRLWFEKKGKAELLESILDLLKDRSLISKVGQDGWEFHSFLQDSILEEIEKERKDLSNDFNDFLLFLTRNYKLDMRFADGYSLNKALVNHLEPLLKYAESLGRKDELIYCFAHLYNVLGNYHLQSNNFFEARKAFKKSLKLAGIEREVETAEKIWKLSGSQIRITALYAQALHYLGKIHFQEGKLPQAQEHFEKALAIQRNVLVNSVIEKIGDDIPQRKVVTSIAKRKLTDNTSQQKTFVDLVMKKELGSIAQRKVLGDIALKKILSDVDWDKNPNPFDIITFQRQGIGWILLEGNKEQLLDAEKLYLNLFKEKKIVEEKEERDEFNEGYCNLQLGRVYLKLAQLVSEEEERKRYYYKAQERLKKGGNESGSAFQGARRMLKEGHLKAGEVFLLLGTLYFDSNCPFGKPEKAKKYFKEAFKKASSSLKNEWSICAKSKHYLAKLYLKENNLEQALVTVTESIYYYDKLGKGLTRILPKEAEEAKQLKKELIEKMFKNNNNKKLMNLIAYVYA